VTPNEILEMLCDRFPNCFVMFERRRKPLKIGIDRDILAVFGEDIDREQLGRALRLYTRNMFYRKAQQAGAPRIDLDGNQAGTVSEADAAGAAKDFANRKAWAIARRQRAMRMASPQVSITPPEPVIAPPAPEPPKRLSLADLRAAAARRKAMTCGEIQMEIERERET
jgi:ProP effector